MDDTDLIPVTTDELAALIRSTEETGEAIATKMRGHGLIKSRTGVKTLRKLRDMRTKGGDENG